MDSLEQLVAFVRSLPDRRMAAATLLRNLAYSGDSRTEVFAQRQLLELLLIDRNVLRFAE